MTTIRNRIRELRRSTGISQEKLAEEMNVTQASISLYETGGNMPIDMLVSISKYFGVTTDYLLGISDDRNIIDPSAEHRLMMAYRDLPIKYRKAIDTALDIINYFDPV